MAGERVVQTAREVMHDIALRTKRYCSRRWSRRPPRRARILSLAGGRAAGEMAPANQ
jgi:hypothetical protein